MSTFNLNMRKPCTISALQAWLNIVQPGFKVIDIIAPDPVELTVVISDEKKEEDAARQ